MYYLVVVSTIHISEGLQRDKSRPSGIADSLSKCNSLMHSENQRSNKKWKSLFNNETPPASLLHSTGWGPRGFINNRSQTWHMLLQCLKTANNPPHLVRCCSCRRRGKNRHLAQLVCNHQVLANAAQCSSFTLLSCSAEQHHGYLITLLEMGIQKRAFLDNMAFHYIREPNCFHWWIECTHT